MSAAGRKRLSKMMKKRWAEGRGPRHHAKRWAEGRGPRHHGREKKAARHMSAAARARIAVAQRARWAKVKAQKRAA